ncbi:MAG: aldo/keto reductase [Betaproteobacteria bacterium]|jgi:D-threo-aldose 1-dehydrogenase|nr:aldo/keto reductase [Betaproteobacteria bacterium]
MNYRRFGRTGLRVSEVVFGGGYVGGLMVLADEDTRRRVLHRALDAGINWIDTAPLYGQGRSEEAIGALLAELAEPPYLSTKVRLDLDTLSDIPGAIERSVHESLRRLRRDSVDLIQLHNQIGTRQGSGVLGAISIEDVLRKGGVADGLERVRKQGLTRYIGLTALGEATAIVRALHSGRFDSAQVYYNLLNPSAARAMPPRWSGHDFSGVCAACARHDVAMMGIRVFASGVLATDLRHGREVVLTENSELAIETQRAHAALNALGAGHGTRAQTALRFALANSDFACFVVGIGEPSHLDEVIEAQSRGPLAPEVVARLEPVYARDFSANA